MNNVIVGVNTHILLGLVADPPKYSVTPSGTPCLRLSLKVGFEKRDGGQGWSFHKAELWGKAADAMKSLTVGQEVYLEGTNHNEKWDDRGVVKYFNKTKAYTCRVLGVKMVNQASSQAHQASPGAPRQAPAPQQRPTPEQAGQRAAHAVARQQQQEGFFTEDDIPF